MSADPCTILAAAYATTVERVEPRQDPRVARVVTIHLRAPVGGDASVVAFNVVGIPLDAVQGLEGRPATVAIVVGEHGAEARQMIGQVIEKSRGNYVPAATTVRIGRDRLARKREAARGWRELGGFNRANAIASLWDRIAHLEGRDGAEHVDRNAAEALRSAVAVLELALEEGAP